MAIGKFKALLTITYVGLDLRKSLFNPGRHIRTKLKSRVVGFLNGGKSLVQEMLPQPGANFEGSHKFLWCLPDHITVIEIIDDTVSFR